jgi:hypothetical protein
LTRGRRGATLGNGLKSRNLSAAIAADVTSTADSSSTSVLELLANAERHQHADHRCRRCRLRPGDDWHIDGTLLDRDGNPLDLTDASIAWTLLDPSGAPVKANAIITVLDPPIAGMINIKLTGATTAALSPGRYTETLRITRAGTTSTFQSLSIIVVAQDPFAR